MNGNVSRLLRRLMLEATSETGATGLTISELARRMGKPRSTVHRHLQGGVVSPSTIDAYAEALAEGITIDQRERDHQRIVRELRLAAGYPLPSENPLDDEVRSMSVELEFLDRQGLDVMWQLIRLLRANRRGNSHQLAASG